MSNKVSVRQGVSKDFLNKLLKLKNNHSIEIRQTKNFSFQIYRQSETVFVHTKISFKTGKSFELSFTEISDFDVVC